MGNIENLNRNFQGMDVDLALGGAGARVAELLRRQSDDPNKPFVEQLDETMLSDLAKVAGTRINPEQYHNDRPVDDNVVFDVAINAGFVKPEIYAAENELEQILDIHSDPERCSEPVEAVIVPGAAGLSNLKRLYHALKAIESGAVKTNRLIIASGQRATSEAERKKLVDAGFIPGDSEYELCRNAVTELLDADVVDTNPVPMRYGEREFSAKRSTATGLDGKLEIEIIETPYDPERMLDNGKPATRANTEETLIPVREILKTEQPVYIVSHDIWQPVQEVIAYRMFPEHAIYGSGPQNLNRVVRDEETGELKMTGASGAQDEMKKYLQEFLKIHPLTAEK